jgi:hypothetical protein
VVNKSNEWSAQIRFIVDLMLQVGKCFCKLKKIFGREESGVEFVVVISEKICADGAMVGGRKTIMLFEILESLATRDHGL